MSRERCPGIAPVASDETDPAPKTYGEKTRGSERVAGNPLRTRQVPPDRRGQGATRKSGTGAIDRS